MGGRPCLSPLHFLGPRRLPGLNWREVVVGLDLALPRIPISPLQVGLMPDESGKYSE